MFPHLMRTVIVPELVFTKWYAWGNRKLIAHRTNPGIYVYAISAKDLEGTEVDWIDVSYIGKAWNQGGMSSRWSEVDRCIRGGAGKRPGSAMFKHLGNYSNWPQRLFVSAMPVDCSWADLTPEHTLKFAWIAYLEIEAIVEFGKRTRERRPHFNNH